ncbi:hypothetical protein V1286_001348 [Bradyrhizobium algeriense]|uniref:DUF736 domain-containing protein n=1 Tax=Bradyrhizobium algeriense TaxID=634784 RepID=A0ABU8B5L9_9BRAD
MSANDLLQVAFGATGNKFRVHLDFGDGKVGQFHQESAVTKIIDCESDTVGLSWRRPSQDQGSE